MRGGGRDSARSPRCRCKGRSVFYCRLSRIVNDLISIVLVVVLLLSWTSYCHLSPVDYSYTAQSLIHSSTHPPTHPPTHLPTPIY